MPVRLPPVTDPAPRILLEGLVDYAGLFPPAALSMAEAVRRFAHYRAGGQGWMLGRFICPAGGLEPFALAADPFLPRDAGAIPWRLAVTGSGDVTADLAAIAAFNERHRVGRDECSAEVDAYETRVTTKEAVHTLAAALPPTLTAYCELPLGDDLPALVAAVAAAGLRAKVRTGGVTADAIPPAEGVLALLRACRAHGVPCKATAGLHHVLGGRHPLTEAADADTAEMYGFAPLFLTAALLDTPAGHQGDTARQLVLERRPEAFVATDEAITWRGPHGDHVFSREALRRLRATQLISFGSCSFLEPAQETRALGWH
jgi:hypothetical protein